MNGDLKGENLQIQNINESDVYGLLNQAKSLCSDGKKKEASAIFKKVISKEPENSKGYWGVYLSEYRDYISIVPAQYAYKRYVNECRDPYGMKAVAFSEPDDAEKYRAKIKEIDSMFENLMETDRENSIEKSKRQHALRLQRQKDSRFLLMIQYFGVLLFTLLVLPILISIVAVFAIIPLLFQPLIGNFAILISIVVIASVIFVIVLSYLLAKFMVDRKLEYHEKRSK
ncbi:MAG: hypothetical protein GX362_03170 [Methanosarcinaceae archaeon]|nr:hypothetical protein [Methanosarcinaceae archaeon]